MLIHIIHPVQTAWFLLSVKLLSPGYFKFYITFSAEAVQTIYLGVLSLSKDFDTYTSVPITLLVDVSMIGT